MTILPRHQGALAATALATTVMMLCALAASAVAASPLPRSDYAVRAACPAPSPGRATCLALQLVPETAEAQAHTHPLAVGSQSVQPASTPAENGAYGLTPGDLHTAYQLPTTASGEQTIALVDSYNDLTAATDLETYDTQLGLPACTVGSGCFKKVNQKGETEASKLPFPKSSAELKAFEAGTAGQREEAREAIGWGAEISLDIETAHAICQSCKIVLVEANSPEFVDMEAAEAAAETLKANEISNSWGGPELGQTPATEEKSAFDHPGTVITASAGDDGYLEWAAENPSKEAGFPASSPHVVAVGGTRLNLKETTHAWVSESVWNDGGKSNGETVGFGAGGGGCSNVFTAPSWQSSVADWSQVGCGTSRAVADIAADADPYTGVAVYDTSKECESLSPEKTVVHWCTYGGTSLASPIIASAYALAGGAHGAAYPAKTLYENASAHISSLHDVISGSNGECSKPFDEAAGSSGCTVVEQGSDCSEKAICVSRSGYDGPTGVGTPHGIAAFQAPTSETTKEKEEHEAEVEHQEEIKHNEELERSENVEREEAERKALEEQEEKESGNVYIPPLPGTPHPTVFPPVVAPPPTVTTATAAATSAATAGSTQLSALALTLKALVALNASHPRISQVSFAFTLSAPAQVRVTLAKRVRHHRHTHWQTTRNSLTLTATSGRISGHFSGHAVLAPGIYRLTAAPAHALARSILFHIG